MYTQEPIIEKEISGVSNTAWNHIFTGMQNVILKYSTALKNDYADIPVTVGGKTGSAQQGVNTPAHAVFVSFAPVKNPETSVTTVLPNGYSGNYSGYVCRDVYAYYYNGEFSEFLNQSSEEGEIH